MIIRELAFCVLLEWYTQRCHGMGALPYYLTYPSIYMAYL